MRPCAPAPQGFALAAALLAGLAAAAPLLDAGGGPPSPVFLRLPGDAPQPGVAIRLEPRADGTWRLRIAADRFAFTGLSVGRADAVPVGYAHVIVDGATVAVAHAPVVAIGPFPPGLHDVTVVLRGQDHRALLGNHGLIKAERTIAVPGA